LRFFLPGVAAENVDIQVTKEAVTVSGDRPAPEPKDGQKVWSEFSYGRFSRTVKLPVAVVNNQAKADFATAS
jgi:HSP20 family protein